MMFSSLLLSIIIINQFSPGCTFRPISTLLHKSLMYRRGNRYVPVLFHSVSDDSESQSSASVWSMYALIDSVSFFLFENKSNLWCWIFRIFYSICPVRFLEMLNSLEILWIYSWLWRCGSCIIILKLLIIFRRSDYKNYFYYRDCRMPPRRW